MVCFNRFARWLLVGVFGLTSFSAFAQVTSTQAYSSCSSAYNASVVSNIGETKCGGSYSNNTSYIRTLGSSSKSCTLDFSNKRFVMSTCYDEQHYDCVTGATTYTSSTCPGSLTSYYYTVFDGDPTKPEPNKCADVQSFNSSSLRAGTANGSGGTCYNGCSYNVSVGYVGTWPAGHMENSFVPTGNACNGEPSATSDAPAEPLDVDGQTPDSSVNPSNGQNTGPDASGGLTCDSPPACTGDAIACNQLYQAWAGRCKEGKDVDLSGIESRLNTLHSDNLDTQSGLNTLHSDNVDIKGGLNELHNDNGYLRTGLNQLHQDTSDVFSSNGEVGDVGGVRQNISLSPDSLDQSGFGFSRSCFIEPIHIAVGAGFVDVNFSDYCDILVWVGYLVVAFASFLSCFILIRV